MKRLTFRTVGLLVALVAGAGTVPTLAANASASAPTSPNYVHAVGLSPTSVYLKWSPAAEPARSGLPRVLLQGYQVWRDGAQIATVGPAVLSYQDTGLAADTAYAYQVVAVNVDGEASGAASATATTLPVLVPSGGPSIHPRLVSPPDRIDTLAAGGAEWDALRNYCDSHLGTLIDPGYAGWDWRDAAVNYGTCYQVARRSNATLAATYARKGLALLAVLARHHNYGTPDAKVQPLGQGDGQRVSFALPFAPMAPASVQVFLVPTREVAVVRTSAASDSIGLFAPITKVANVPGGPAAYAPGSYRPVYRDALGTYRLGWPGPGPAVGATYYLSVADGNLVPAAAGSFAISGGNVVFSAAPGSTQTVMVRYLGANYEQTGNGLGGLNAVQPDGPGYQMRTFNVGLALGYDLLYGAAGFGPALKAEFHQVLGAQIDWYTAGGYENDGDIGNYFIRGYLTGTFATAYATDGENPRAAELKALADDLMLRTYAGMARYLPGGYGPQGQYANGTTIDVLQILSLYRDVTGLDLLARLEWTDNVVAATIHGTKPGRATFYDGGDWSDLPAVPLTDALAGFVQYRPDHEAAPFARKLLAEVGQPVPGTMADYRQYYPLSYLAKVSGPFYARSSWEDDAAWMSLAAGEIATDHQHLDQGHLTLNRGADALLVDAGGYDYSNSRYHNTFLIDDRGAGDISVYPPSQGYWGIQAQIVKAGSGDGFAYGQADYGDAYIDNHRTGNSVRRALRSVLFVHPGVFVVFDQVQTARPDVKKTFNLNFGGPLVDANGTYVTTVGDSKLFLQTILPFQVTPAIAPIAGDGITSTNYQETLVGNADDAFLHVFQVADASASTMDRGKLMRSVDALAQGAEVSAGSELWVALFAARDRALGGAVQYRVPTPGAHRHVVNDLLPGNSYVVSVTDLQGAVSRTMFLESDHNGTLTFDSQAGEEAFYLSPGPTAPATIPPIVGDPNAPPLGVSSPTASSITSTGATLGGTVTSSGGGAITERGVVYSVTSTNGNPAIGGPGVTRVPVSGTTGAFAVAVSGLARHTAYSFKAYARTASTTVYTPASTFTTLADLPAVTSPTAAAVTSSGAKLGGNVTGDGGGAITERGVVYAASSVNGNPVIGGSGVTRLTAPGTTGVFTLVASGLAPSTAYSFKAYARNEAGTTYTSTGTFTTSVALSITRPATAGLAWRAGTVQAIQWAHKLGSGALVNLEISRDDGAHWSPIATNVASGASTGSYAWTVTAPVTTQARFRVVSVATPTLVSTNPYPVRIDSRVLVKTPNAALSLRVGQSTVVKWNHNYPGAGHAFTVGLDRDGNGTCEETLTRATLSTPDGSFTWTVAGPSTTRARVCVAADSDPLGLDVSDAFLTIGRLSVTAPASGVRTGTTTPIKWTHDYGSGHTFAIGIDRNGDQVCEQTIAAAVPGAAGTATYNWLVTGPSGSENRICVKEATDPVGDVSDKPFRISRVLVTSPNSRVSWAVGTTHALTWTHDYGAGRSFRIDLDRNGDGTCEEAVASGVAGTSAGGSYDWVVSGPTGTTNRICVAEQGDPAGLDGSNNNFTIAP